MPAAAQRLLLALIPVLAVLLAARLLVPVTAAFTSSTSPPSSSFTAGTWTFAGTANANNPQFYYRLDDASGVSSAADSSGNNRPATLSSVAQSTTNYAAAGAPIGSTDTAAYFNGSSTLVSTPSAITGPTTFSLELWFKTVDTNGGLLLGFGSSATGLSGSRDRMLYIDSGGRLTFGVWTTTAVTVRSTGTVTDGNWHYVAVTTNGTTATLYLDAQAAVSAASAAGQNYSGYWKVGGEDLSSWPNQPANYYVNAYLDEVAVYPTVLTAAQVSNHRTATGTSTSYRTAVLAQSPSMYWRLGEAWRATQAVDASPNGVNGNYYNFGPAIITGQSGALSARQANAAMRFDGRTAYGYSTQSYYRPNDNTWVIWFKTTTTTGGQLFGYSDAYTFGGSTDRIMYMSDNGAVNFFVYPGNYPSTIYAINSAAGYNDGNWHMAAASLGSGGMKLYLDGTLVASNLGVTYGYNITGYVQFGSGSIASWYPGGPTSPYFAGTLDDFVGFGSQLSAATISKLYIDGTSATP